GKLIEHGFVDWDLTDSDVALCGIIYGGPIGALVGGLIAPPLGVIVGGLIGSVIGIVVAAILGSVFAGQKTLVGNFSKPSCNVIDQHNFICTTSLVLPELDFGAGVRATLAITQVDASAELILAGTALVAKVGNPQFEMSQPDDSVTLGVGGYCGSHDMAYLF